MTKEPWRILLTESVHLLGLFMIHARHAGSARATDVLFDQFLRHLTILGNMPGHDEGILIRRAEPPCDGTPLQFPNYHILFGNIIIRGNSTAVKGRSGRGSSSRFGGPLQQAFGCLAEQGIQTLYLQLPGESETRIDQLRLALNIVARYRHAAGSGTSITFRYFGRTITVPLIRDSHGVADPNLTMLAGLNGLSSANTRELIKQAQSLCKLESAGKEAAEPVNWFDQIFSIRSLRTHIIRPPLEVNHIPWSQPRADAEPSTTQAHRAATQTGNLVPGIEGDGNRPDGKAAIQAAFGPQLLIDRLGHPEGDIAEAIKAVFAVDYSTLTPVQTGRRVLQISRLLYTLDEQVNDPDIVEQVLRHLSVCLAWIPESVLLITATQPKGMRIGNGRNALLVGMVHPRLFDLIVMVKERLLTRLKTEAVHAFGLGFKEAEIATLATRFEVGISDAEKVVALLEACFDSHGHFKRSAFEARTSEMEPFANIIFEIMWCLYKRTAERNERLDLMFSIQHVIALLKRPNQAMRFLLSDICQNPFEVKHMDRDAFMIANGLLGRHIRQPHIEFKETPEKVLTAKMGVDQQTRKYASWRLDSEQVRILAKMRAIDDALQHAADPTFSERPQLFDYDFLISLEREIFLFLALVGGQTARIILRQSLLRYGRFESGAQGSLHPSSSRPSTYSQLLIIVRGLGRIGTQSDATLLREYEQKIADRLISTDWGEHDVMGRRIHKALSHSLKAIQYE